MHSLNLLGSKVDNGPWMANFLYKQVIFLSGSAKVYRVYQSSLPNGCNSIFQHQQKTAPKLPAMFGTLFCSTWVLYNICQFYPTASMTSPGTYFTYFRPKLAKLLQNNWIRTRSWMNVIRGIPFHRLLVAYLIVLATYFIRRGRARYVSITFILYPMITACPLQAKA